MQASPPSFTSGALPVVRAKPKWRPGARFCANGRTSIWFSIDADLVPNEPRAVATMLDDAGLGGVENWTFGDSFVERLRYEVDPRWRGEIPRTILIGRDGATSVIEGVTDLADSHALA